MNSKDIHEKIFLYVLFISGISYWWISSTPHPPKGIILISLDTLRADHLGAYGYHRYTSPHIDAFGRESVIFENAVVSAPWTLPSHMSMMTLLYSSFHGVYKTMEQKQSIADKHVTLAELLRAGGYKTAAFVDGGWMRKTFRFNQGFDVYDDRKVNIAEILPKAKNNIAEDNHDISKKLLSQFRQFYSTVPTSKAPIAAIDEQTRKQLEALGYINVPE